MDLDSLNPRERLETLSAYLDGELSDEAARDVTAWLERHPEALREVEHQRRLWSLLGRYPDEPVPEGFAQRVLATVRPAGASDVPVPAASTPHVRLLRRRVWAFSAAAAVLAAIGTAVVLGARKEPGPGEVRVSDELVALDADFVQHTDLAQMASLSDDQFAVLLIEDPDALVDGGGVQGG